MKINKPRKKYLTYAECAEFLGRTESGIYLLVSKGQLELADPEIILRDESKQLHQAPNSKLSQKVITLESAERFKILIDQAKSKGNKNVTSVKNAAKPVKVFIKGRTKPKTYDTIKSMLTDLGIPLSAWRKYKGTGEYYKDKYKFSSAV